MGDTMALPTSVKTMIGPTILLSNGEYFDLLAPETSVFGIDVIAHGLANVCRFAGQCREFYSVAQHSVHVSEAVSADLAMCALLHDASEAFIHDITKPLKDLLPDYRLVEDRIEADIARRFGTAYPLPSEIKRADRRLLRAEQRDLMANADTWSSGLGVEPWPLPIVPWPPKLAAARFLARFHDLSARAERTAV